MNAQQRKFLIDRVTEKTQKKIKELKDKEIRFPSASNYIFKAALNGELKLKPDAHTLAAIHKKALNAKEGENWLSGKSGYNWDREDEIKLKLEDLLELPDDFKTAGDNASEHNKKIRAQIKELETQLETLEVRIQLASNKTLANLIKEVDDMGDLSLMDNKLKLLE